MENALAVQTDTNIMPTLTPQEQVEKASEMAKVLQQVVNQADLAKSLGGKKKHLEYEAWQTIGQFFNCTPQTEWTRPIMDNDKIIGYEARVHVVNGEGRVIGAAESMCMRDEQNWKNKPLYAIRSMAQTRTAGKAMRSVFAWVAVLAGYSATPLEEMDGISRRNAAPPKKPAQKTTDMKKFLGVMEEIKATLSELTGNDNTYYSVLGSFNYTHANEIKKREHQVTIYEALKVEADRIENEPPDDDDLPT